MPTITRTLRVRTDDAGRYETSQTFNPPGFWDYNVRGSVTLLSPPDTTIEGTIEISAANHTTDNPVKHFRLSTGETEDLGGWQLDGGDNTVRISGQTSPARANEIVEVRVTADV
ncbi:MAG: hypothetical protein M3384_19050 [Acidobacteriota bacterium]|nr:hypothetical protein [Acidobacteriota bacterium]